MSSFFKKFWKKSTKNKRQNQERPGNQDVGNDSGTQTEESDSDSSLSRSSEVGSNDRASTFRPKKRLKGLRLRHKGGGADGAMEKSLCGDAASGASAAAAGPGITRKGDGDSDEYSVVEMVLKEDDDLKCSCCYELMVDPTTLNCGHSFCRHCLALWLAQSKQHICPQCRSVWMGYPQINYSLRNIMKNTLPNEYKRREAEVQGNKSFQSALKNFNDVGKKVYELQQQGIHVPGQNLQRRGVVVLIERAIGVNWQNVMAFKNGVFLTVAVICAFYLLSFMYHWLFEHEEELVSRWSVDQVQSWLKDQGEWAEKAVAPKFLEKQISGNLLLALNEEDFKNMVSLDDLHHRALVLSVDALREQGKDVPSSVFQYKARFFGRAVFLLFGLRNYPRSTIFWMYMFCHDELFLPFVHVTSPVLENMADLSLFSFQFPLLTLSQWIDFGINLVFFPYWLIAKFAWRCSNISWVQTFLTVMCCLAKTGMEGVGVRLIFRNPRKLTTAVTNHLKQISAYPLAAGIWNFIPSFLINICFYSGVYIMPFIDVYNLYNLWRHTIAR